MSESGDNIVFGQPCIDREEIDAVVEVLESKWIGKGPRCRRFEEEFAAFKGIDDALALSSCTAALFLALKEVGVGPGREVLTTPITFAATANVIEHLGAVPVFVDVDPITGNMDPEAAVRAANERTAAVLVVHLAGRPVDLGPLLEMREKRGIPIVEDCAHAISGSWQGRPLGTIGDAGTFSFYATKNITTAEGGMLLMPDADRLAHCRRLSLHGLSADAWARYQASPDGFRHFQVTEPGYKMNLTDVQAALGLVQLGKMDAHQRHRAEVLARYPERLDGLPLVLPPDAGDGMEHGLHLFSPQLRLEDSAIDRDELLARLQRRGIGCGVHYVSLHLHPFYRDRYEIAPDALPGALAFSERSFSLPLSGCLPLESVDRVAAAVRASIEEGA